MSAGIVRHFSGLPPGEFPGRAADPSAARPRVLVLLPRGEAIRNFVYTGMLARLQRHVDVVLLSVLPSEDLRPVLQEDVSSFLELHEVAVRRPVRVLGDLVEMAHGRWLWSAAARERWRLRDAEAGTAPARVKRGIKKALSLPFASRRGVETLSALQGVASRWLRTSDAHIDLLRRIAPSLVFNGSHVHSHLAVPVVEAARWLKIPTAAFLFSWDNLTSQGRIVPPYDHYLVWNQGLRDQLLDLYHRVEPARVHVTGTPQFDFHMRPEFRLDRNAFCRRVGADPERPIVLYTTGMANHMPGEPILVERVADLLRTMTDLASPQLLVRVYAKDRTGRFDELKARRPEILFPEVPWERNHLTPRPEDSSLLTSTLAHCAVGINVASTVSLELCMFDKPALNIGYNPPGFGPVPVDYIRYYSYDHYKPIIESGAVELARSEQELRDLLRGALTAPQRRRPERQRLLQSFFGETLDGWSAVRVARTLVRIAQGSAGPGRDAP